MDIDNLKPDSLLRGKELAEALTKSGRPIKEKTLPTKRPRGGGPPFRMRGRFPFYPWGEVVAWWDSGLSDLRRSPSEADVQKTDTPAVKAEPAARGRKPIAAPPTDQHEPAEA